MSVKNINKYHDLNIEELNKLGTRELVAVLVSARGRKICSCGKGHHCGDEALEESERIWNKKQYELYLHVKDVLKDRADISRKEIPKKIEKSKCGINFYILLHRLEEKKLLKV